jgi:hypothetical protein
MELLEVMILLLGKTMGTFLRVIKTGHRETDSS